MCASLFCPSITRQRLIFVSLKRSRCECVCDMQIKYVWRGPVRGLCHKEPRQQRLHKSSLSTWQKTRMGTALSMHACWNPRHSSTYPLCTVYDVLMPGNVCKLRSGRYNCYQCLVFSSRQRLLWRIDWFKVQLLGESLVCLIISRDNGRKLDIYEERLCVRIF